MTGGREQGPVLEPSAPTAHETVTARVIYEAEAAITRIGSNIDRDQFARRALDSFDDQYGRYKATPKVLRVLVDGVEYDAAGEPRAYPTVTLDRAVTRDAVAAFIDALRAERRVYAELYADRMAEFIDEAHQTGVPAALKQLRKELPK